MPRFQADQNLDNNVFSDFVRITMRNRERNLAGDDNK